MHEHFGASRGAFYPVVSSPRMTMSAVDLYTIIYITRLTVSHHVSTEPDEVSQAWIRNYLHCGVFLLAVLAWHFLRHGLRLIIFLISLSLSLCCCCGASFLVLCLLGKSVGGWVLRGAYIDGVGAVEWGQGGAVANGSRDINLGVSIYHFTMLTVLPFASYVRSPLGVAMCVGWKRDLCERLDRFVLVAV